MSIERNGKFVLGTTWTITGTCLDSAGKAIDLTGGQVQMRIYNLNPNVILIDMVIGANGNPDLGMITKATAGEYQFTLNSNNISIPLASYQYEIRCTDASDEVYDQNFGVLEVKPSAYTSYTF